MIEHIHSALNALSEPLKSHLIPIFERNYYRGFLSKKDVDALLAESELSIHELRLALLPVAAAYAYVPISDFHVGAIATGVSGNLYFGTNLEFSGSQIGQTVHAEQCAISHAWMSGESGLANMTVNYSPCGHCRQFMNELPLANELEISLPGRETQTLTELLPDAFGPNDLDITDRLMGASSLLIESATESQTLEQSNTVQRALQALQLSHAPYSKSPSGLCLTTKNEEHFCGAYAENAAFNPSLPPLQVALCVMRMHAKSFEDINQVALVESRNAHIQQKAGTESLLTVMNPNLTLDYQQIN